MNYKVKNKTLFKIYDYDYETPYQLFANDNIAYYNRKNEMKYINIKTKKNLTQEIKLVDPYFSILDDLKIFLKESKNKVSLYKIEKDLSSIAKIKDMKIADFILVKSLSNGGYILCNEKFTKIYNNKDQLETNIKSDNGFSYFKEYEKPFEINLSNQKSKKHLLLFLSLEGKNKLYEINNLNDIGKKGALIPRLTSDDFNEVILDYIILDENYIILIDPDQLHLVNLNNYKIEQSVECPQESPYDDIQVYSFISINNYKDNIFVTYAGYFEQGSESFIMSFWKFDKNKKRVELIQSNYEGFFFMLNKEKFIVLERLYDDNGDDFFAVSQVKITETKQKVETIETTTISESKNKES